MTEVARLLHPCAKRTFLWHPYSVPQHEARIVDKHACVKHVQDRKNFNLAGLDSNHSHFILVEDENYSKGAGFGCGKSFMVLHRGALNASAFPFAI